MSLTNRRDALPARSALATAVALAFTSAGVAAQSGLEEITVQGRAYGTDASSRKFTAPLLDTPKSVTVIPADLMEDRAATSLVEALRSVPGVTFNAGEGGQPAGDNLKIRGFDAGADVFIDGVRDAGSQTRDVFALEAVEVIKGPGSAYTGRGSTGGSVNLVTKKPKAENFLTTNFGTGTDGYLRAAVDANYRFADSLALRVNVLGQQSHVPGRDSVSIDHRGIAPSLSFGIDRPTRVNVGHYHYRTDDVPDYSLPYSRNAANTAAAGEPVDVDRDNFYGVLNRDFQKTGADVSTVEVEHDFGDRLTLRNTTRYGQTSNHYIVTNPDDSRGNVANGFVLRNSKSRNSTTTTRANLTDISGAFAIGRSQHSFAAGIEASSEEMFNRNYSVDGLFDANANSDFDNSCSAPGAAGPASGYNCTTLDAPNPRDPWTGTIEPSGNATLARTETRSAYMFDTIGFDARWSLNLGLRHDGYDTRQRSGSIEAPTEIDNSADFWNYQVGAVFKPVSWGSVYLSTGTSSNPSGNTLGDGTENLGANNANLEPESNRTYELGTKWELFDHELALSAAVFHTEKSNARVSIEPGRGGAQQTVGEQHIDGFEIGVSGNITDKWRVLAGYTRLDSVIADDGPISEDEGNEFPNTPRNSASLWTTYEVLPNFRIGAGATYVDRRFGNTANTVWVPSYVTYDAMAALEIGPRTLLQVNVQNLTDEAYFVRPYTTHYAAIGPARSAVVSVALRF